MASLQAPPALRRDRSRSFSHMDKNLCWRAASAAPDRHPRRWRKDKAGNIVCRALRGCSGPLCFEFDHVVPWSNGGRSEARNCAVVQTAVNRWKGNMPPESVTVADMKRESLRVGREFTAYDLDVIEMAIYGDILRPDGTRLTQLPAPAGATGMRLVEQKAPVKAASKPASGAAQGEPVVAPSKRDGQRRPSLPRISVHLPQCKTM
ncbi:hypothetical protein CDCA_CDCA10G2915 [Cyanidium caldarium]|uniref:HNH nuclease domain-containing protein n=1 Tax=Cyanidium caldarium TaxID=2771 RepID=A0AAV9IXR1_CYACA|nr:hypothetical protein CDCA_CDCA10G2915 [Cyanidium caldarium]|eukprot:ctg_1780.g385